MLTWHRYENGLEAKSRTGKLFQIRRHPISPYFYLYYNYTRISMGQDTARRWKEVCEELESTGTTSRSLQLDEYTEDIRNLPSTPVNTSIETSSLGRAIIDTFTSDKTFGVELELEGKKHSIMEAVQEAGYSCNIEAYSHSTPRVWKIVTDASVSNGCELVSPILKGKAGAEALYKVCKSLQKKGIKVNRTCGFHVHVGMDTLTYDASLNQWKNIFDTYSKMQEVINTFMPESRKNNRYCKSLHTPSRNSISRATTLGKVGDLFTRDRYYVVNWYSYSRHSTVEFRHHSGTCNPIKALNWVLFCLELVDFSKDSFLERKINNIEDIPFLTPEQVQFYQTRAEELQGE